MMDEPEWLAAEPTDRAKLTAIIGAVRRCYAECPGSGAPATGPHMTTTMAELFIGQMMITADQRIRASERERIRVLSDGVAAAYAPITGGLAPFSELLEAP